VIGLDPAGLVFEVDEGAPELGKAGLAFPPALLLAATKEAEQLLAAGAGNLVEAEERGDVIGLEAAVARLDPADLAGGDAEYLRHVGTAEASVFA
jgi:hypothetical protein